MKQVLVIYVASIVHWVGAYTTIGMLYVLLEFPGILTFLLGLLAFVCLPPIFAIEEKEDLDE